MIIRIYRDRFYNSMSQFLTDISVISVSFIMDQIWVLISLQDAKVLFITLTEFNVCEFPVTRGIHGLRKTVFENKCRHVDIIHFTFGCFEETNLRLQIVERELFGD